MEALERMREIRKHYLPGPVPRVFDEQTYEDIQWLCDELERLAAERQETAE